MRESPIPEISLLLLVLAFAGCSSGLAREKPDLKARNSQAEAPEKQAQSGQPRKTHVVRGRFEPGSTDRELAFIFDISPAPEVLPGVRWVGENPSDGARTLVVRSGDSGRYSTVLADVPSTTDGQVLIELSGSDPESFEIHSAEFALRQHVATQPSSRPSRNGHFVVFTKPAGVSPELRLLIGSNELPIEDLPRGVTTGAVAGVYSLDFLPAIKPVDGWLLTMAIRETDAKPVIFYLAKGRAEWRLLESTPLEGHSLLGTSFAGPGTYLLVREVAR